MSEQYSSFEGIELTTSDDTVISIIVVVSGDPSQTGLDLPVGSMALSTNGKKYFKHNTGSTDWSVDFTDQSGELNSLTNKPSLSASDLLLIEDNGDSFSKKSATIQSIVDLVSISSSLPAYEDFSNIDLCTISSTNPKTTLSGTTLSLPSGKYRIAWSYFWNSSRLLENFTAEILLDGTVQRTHVESISEVDTAGEYGITCNDQRVPASGFFTIDFLTPVTHTLEIRVKTESLTYQVSIWDQTIEIQRVG